ncbi:HAD family hydrolase [Actinoplanes sp. N902-109]|uniref:HAD-IIIC family phosphatase n=1 Tax=Actinoplanes sp. (strain N902-109) TaxID=649831 RepID=UPI00032955F5|nr:HAD-IIIC family phosphatase [Actinoplanes sp. N902-109]AGL15973.1 ChlD1 [Actinoplanes sp. N902-109]
MPTADEELTALHRAGRLAEEFPRVVQLLAELEPAQLSRAGRLLARLDPEQLSAAHPGLRTVTVAITGHGTLGTLVPALTAELARHSLILRPRLTSFDSYVFELGDPGSELYRSDPDLVLAVLDPEIVGAELPLPWTADDAARVLEGKVTLVERLATTFEQHSRGALVLNTLPMPRRYPGQLVDQRSRARLGVAWRTANMNLLRLVENHPRVSVVDLDPLLAEGVPVADARMHTYAKAHLSEPLLAAYAREVAHLARAVLGRTRKCLVVDLDNTVWGGVLGDDGPDGIEVDGTHRGEAFRDFQRVLRQIRSQGIPLAAVSKNDLEPVRRVLREHPGMTVREDDFVRVVANWRPKHDNLRELAATLNLGIDALVFADDSAFECGLVRQELPAVAVVRLDDDPAGHVDRLLRDGWFDTRELTDDDLARAERYREESDRADFLHSFTSLDDYLRELAVRVEFGPADPADLARVAQLTLRTNQFNLTTQRLQHADVTALAADPDALVLSIRSRDRFGENGLVGAILAHRSDDGLHIDNAVLSCRVFSRGIEHACLSALLQHAAATGATAVHGTYRPTARNGTVRDFYPRYGFTVVDEDPARTTFRHDLARTLPPPDHVVLHTSLEGAVP